MHNEIIFITGASSGFGYAFAELLAQKGAKLIISARRMEKLQALQQTFGANQIHILELDVQDKASVAAKIAALPKEFADITVLINNAGLALGMEKLHEKKLDDIDIMIDTNIKGLLYCTHNILPGMVARNRGYIINIGSIAGTYPYPGGNVYGATKAFVKQLSLNLRADLLGTNIRVTNIEPGNAETEFAQVRFRGDSERAKSVYTNSIPLSAGDIANIVVWCISQPVHVNLNAIEVMPTCQAFSPLAIYRDAR